MPQGPTLDDPLAIIEEEARAVAVSFGIGPCAEVAAAVIDRIILRMGGEVIYVPRKGVRERARVAAAIRERYDGTNIPQLAKEFKMSPLHVRRIVQGGR